MPRPLTISLNTKITHIVESLPFSIIMALVTIYALFGDDIRILSVNKDGDSAFFGVTIFCIVCFTLEIIFTCICKKEYLFNVIFFFYIFFSFIFG